MFTRADGASGDSSFSVATQGCLEITYSMEDGEGGTAHTTGLPMSALSTDRFGNIESTPEEFRIFLFDVVDPSVSCPDATVSVSQSDSQETGSR